MKLSTVPSLFVAVVAAAAAMLVALAATPSADREPPVVTPGTTGSPPSDAVVLFDGKDLSAWKSEDGSEPRWKVADGFMQVGFKGLMTRQEFGAIQLHLEWASPAEVKGDGQGRGNSGVYFQGRYEIQVLDSYQNKTYFNGQAASFYGHNAPLVNASRKPGEWQSYDIVFHPPTPGADGKVRPGSFTVFHNGVLVQDHIPVQGDASVAAKFSGATPTGPLLLQDHGNPVRYRNIWLRKLD
ncbi:MAG: DUF1080 domain-containing protein [Verrucomicrobia bacterium]|nr:DUF1080 domain-containing protein [Verrucomicrobiota bacterium]